MNDSSRLPSTKLLAGDVDISYSTLDSVERWVKDRVQSKSTLKTVFTAIAVVTCVIGLIILGTVFAGAIWNTLGTQAESASEWAARTSANQTILNWYCLAVAAGLLAAAYAYLTQPTHLRLSANGLCLVGQRLGLQLTMRSIRWNEVQAIELNSKVESNGAVENYLTINVGTQKPMKVKVSAIGSQEERLKLRDVMQTYAGHAVADEQVLASLEPEHEQAYTQLWLQALTAPSARLLTANELVSGAVVGERYTVKSKLGTGGQGSAYLAMDKQSNGGSVVLKEFILPVYVNITVRKQSLQAMENEARILQQLNHSSIVKLIDFLCEDQRGYLVLEYIDGVTLKEKVLNEGPLSEQFVRQLCGQMCSILQYLHSLSPPVVHRDFTPDNLILRPDGKLTLVDFNVAMQSDTGADLNIVGKHAYLPPEQFRGASTPASDIYAMGGTLFFLLTGQDPEPICVNHPQFVRSEVSAELNALVAKATAIDAKQRFANAADIEKALGISAKTGS